MSNISSKRTLSAFSALAAASVLAVSSLLSASCTKDDSSLGAPSKENFSEARTPLTVGISGKATKSTTISSDDEVAVNTLQVLVFRGDYLDAYGKVSSQSSITLSCTAGERTVYAFVNTPDLNDISSKTALLEEVSLLSENSSASFQMAGSTSVTLPSASTINIDVDRMASRVSVKKITRNFTSAALSSLPFSVDAGSYPEGMSFAILLFNGVTPLLNHYIGPKRFGEKKK